MTLNEIIEKALQEDIGDGDHTSHACIPSTAVNKAQLIIKQNGVLAGIEVAQMIFKKVDDSLKVTVLLNDRAQIKKGDVAFIVEGKSISILSAERLVLNVMQRMSGIATHTHDIVQQLKGFKTKVLDTRKTTPNFRLLEKMAVKIGGGENHRMGLYDMILIKDNHVDFAGGIRPAIENTLRYLKEKKKNLKIEVEARNLQEVKEIIACGGVHRIMLDNFSFADLKKAVEIINSRYETEASGGITIENIKQYAECGVDFISVGALTHRFQSIDMSLKAIK